jgi:two-component system response regulator FixJ
MTTSPTIFIIDDDAAVRDSLELLLESAGFRQVAAYSSSRAFLDEATPRPGDCLLLDIRMPGMDGLELQDELAQRGTRVPVVMMTGHGDVPIAVRAMKAGAVDFIEKPFSDDIMLESVRRALALGAAAQRKEEASGEVMGHLASLTAREREVLEGMVAGHPNKVIAHELGISPRTVEIHRARVMEKMAARSLSALVRMALAAGVAPRPS